MSIRPSVDNRWIQERVASSIAVKQAILTDERWMEMFSNATQLVVSCFKNRGKVLLCGNGGSAADAQHIAAELSGRFYKDRAPLFAEALHVNTSYLTAVGNDYSFDEVYARLVEAKGREGDVLIGLSTSGNSKNVVRAVEKANALGLITIAFTGESGGALDSICTVLLKVPSADTARIQESHILMGHILCEAVEKELF